MQSFFNLKFLTTHILLSVIVLFGCNSNEKKAEQIMNDAGNNRKELEKTIEHYKKTGDKEKLDAAYFLIENMQNKYGQYSEIVISYYSVFESLKKFNLAKIDPDTIDKLIMLQWDSVERKVAPISYNNLKTYQDYHVISADYLIENIDYAFKAWKEKPWSKHYDFKQFCEFILPYRLMDEPIQLYRKELYNEFSWIEDSLKDKTNPLEASKLVSDFIAKRFNFCNKLGKCPLLGVSDLYKLMGGICEHRYLLVGSILRSIGIPACVDFTPQFNNNAIGHAWLVTIDKSGEFIPFNGGEKGIPISDTLKFPINGAVGGTKIYRRSFYEKPIEISKEDFEDLFPIFKNRSIYEVSHQYKYKQLSVTFDMPDNYEYPRHVYLCSFGYGLKFIPTAYTKPASGKAIFNNMCTDCVYFLAEKDKQIKVLSNPLYLKGDSTIKLNPDFNTKREVILTRKFKNREYIYKMRTFAAWLKGAKFQAADDKHFSKPVTLYEIDRKDYWIYTEKDIALDKPYRYYRYLSADTSKIRVAELGFIANNANIRDASVYGYCNNCDADPIKPVFENAFDKKISTNLNGTAGSWVALDFKKPVIVDKVYFLIRNDLNAIDVGDTYELFYFNMGWVSLGKKVANNLYLNFQDVPDNALLLLKDLTKGREERIFLFKDGKQVWL